MDSEEKSDLTKYTDHQYPVPIGIKTILLKSLNRFTREQIYAALDPSGVSPLLAEVIGDCENCNWTPEECTIDLSIVVRLFDNQEVTLNLGTDTTGNGSLSTIKANTESDIRAIANIIQIKSGHGVVMAGLIGDREVEEAAKVPVLGDLPLVGYLFRSRVTSRQKTKIVVFVEAEILDRDPNIARAEAQHDFLLSHPFVEGELLDNPLQAGMYRAGFGSYLPPATHNEEIFWKRHARKVRKMMTHVSDALR